MNRCDRRSVREKVHRPKESDYLLLVVAHLGPPFGEVLCDLGDLELGFIFLDLIAILIQEELEKA